jgi:signal transduction histidine kinase/putative methionine-R-sulfoxide reductase with GAF domain/ActR/RegA family two-component response regulator
VEGAAAEPRTDGVVTEVSDPFSSAATGARRRHLPLSAMGLLVTWLFLSTGLCYLIATAEPGRAVPLVLVAVILAGLGALLGFAVATERRAADRRLNAELKRASNMLRSIEAVTDPGLAFLDLDELLGAVLGRTKDAIGGDVVCVLLMTDDGSNLRVQAATGATELAPVGSEVPVGKGVLGTAAQWSRPVVVAEVGEGESDALPDSQHGTKSLMAAPLIVHGKTLGIVEVGSLKQRGFGSGDLRLLQVVADRLAALVERARLNEEAKRSRFGAEHANMHLRILARSGTVLSKALENYEVALGELADVVVPEFADWFGVYVLEESGKIRRVVNRARPKVLGGHVFMRAGNPHPRGDELVHEAMAERRAQILIPTARLDPTVIGATVHTPETLGEWSDVGSMMAIPVQVRGSFMATLSFVTAPGRRGYRPSDLQTAKELADRVGVAIERVLSWRTSQRSGEMAFQYAERLRRLVDAALVVNAQFSEDEVLHLLVEHTHRALDADLAVVSSLPSGGTLAEKVWPAERFVDQPGRDEDIRGVVHAAAEIVARSGEVVRRPDEWTGAGTLPGGGSNPISAAAAAAALRVRGWVAAPITDGKGEVRRVVVAVGAVGSQFTFEDESVLTLLAQMTSVALRNAGLYAEVVGNEQRLQTLVDSSPLAIAELRPTGEAQWWNRAAAELFDWPDNSVPRRIPVRAGSELVLAGLLESSFAGKPIVGVAIPVTGAGEEPLELSVSASPLGFADTVTGLLLVAEDVTERQRLLEQFYQAERLNAMSRMAGAVAHDFNNLLTVILGCSDVLMRRLGDDQDLGPDVAAIQRAGTRAAALTNQLVRIGGQQQPVEPEITDIDEVITNMRPMLAGVLGENIRLQVKGGARGATALLDRSELERSVLNLTINARDAMPAGGTFTVETGRPSLRQASGEELVELVFADTGVGMDEETAAHCFEPFFTTKGRARGTGLGLAAVHAMVSQAAGDIRLETSPGRGARFTLAFPVVDASVLQPSPASPGAVAVKAGALAAPSGETILVVDDEPEVLRLEVRELQSAGYDVLGASNASEALHLLSSRGLVDMLVTDVVMPGMNGVELAAAVRWRYPDMPVLFVSGHVDEDATVSGSLPEQATLLTKPFGPDELTRRVREALDRARLASSERGRPKGGDANAVAPGLPDTVRAPT